MKELKLSIILFLVLCFVCGKFTHFQSTSDSQAYLDALLAKETQLRESLAKIHSNIKYIRDTVNQLKQMPEMQVVTLEDGLADQLSILNEMQQNLTLPLALKTVDCTQISEDNLEQIKVSIAQVKDDLSLVKQQIQKLKSNSDPSQQKIIDGLNIQKEWAQTYLKNLQAQSLAVCPSSSSPEINSTNSTNSTASNQTIEPNGIIDVTGMKKYPNLDGDSWFYGNITEPQYKLNLFNYITSNNVTKCSVEKPYAVLQTTKCFNCYSPTPYFNLGTQSCEKCPEGTNLDVATHKCVSTNCTATQLFNSQTNKCFCPTSMPYFDGKQCQQCILPKFWNTQTLTCEQCQQGSVFKTELGKCEQCPPEKPTVVGLRCGQCESGQFYNSKTSACQSCSKGQTYNITAKACECSSDLPLLNPETKQCEACPEGSTFDETLKKCSECPGDQTKNPKTLQCECPPEKPLFTNSTCESCDPQTFYNEISKSCESCPEGQTLNSQTKTCQCQDGMHKVENGTCVICTSPSYWNEELQSCSNCAEGQIYDPNSKSCTACPQQTPLFKNGSCLACEQGSNYSKNANTCVKCQQGQIFDSTTGKCKSQCLAIGQTFNSETKECECPEDKPYSNDVECMSCESPQFWNQTSKVCSVCPDGTIFSAENKACEACPSETPLEKDGKCVACPDGSNYMKTLKICLMCFNSTFNKDTEKCLAAEKPQNCSLFASINQTTSECQCPEGKPYDNGKECLACASPNFWNISSKSCETCKDGFVFENETSTCKECPAQKPIELNGVCKTCPDNSQYNKELKICVMCAKNEMFQDGVCISKVVNVPCPRGANKNPDTNACECPPVTPYNNGVKCIACDLPRYWDEKAKICNQCADGTVYSPNSKSCQSCPPVTPIEKDGKCIKCPANSYFDATDAMCIHCGLKTTYNAETGKCEEIQAQPQCPPDATYDKQAGKCVCPPEMPHNNGGACVKCENPLYWLEESKMCTSCENGNVLNQQTNTCEPCPQQTPLQKSGVCSKCPQNSFYKSGVCVHCAQGSILDKESLTCLSCHGGSTFNKELKKCVCPQSTPFYNGFVCQPCSLPFYWDVNTLTCKQCPFNQHFETQLGKCVSCPNALIFDATINKCVEDKSCRYQGLMYDEGSKSCICNKQVPFFNGEKCVSCVAPYYWNPSTKSCETCSSNEVYNEVYLKCIPCQEGYHVNFETKTCEPKECSKQMVKNQEGKCVCPEDKPYSTGASCVSCNFPSYWNEQQKSCSTCYNGYYNGTSCVSCNYNQFMDLNTKNCVKCPNKFHYDRFLKMCASCPVQFSYHPLTDKCVFITCEGGKVYNFLNGLCQCESSTPFWDGNSCVSCAGHWNQYIRRCIVCEEDQHWDENAGNCVTCPINFAYDESLKTCTRSVPVCTGGKVYDSASGSCLCLSLKPHWNGNQCISCPDGSHWSKKNLCVTCKENEYWSEDEKMCASCISGYNYNYKLQACEPLPPTCQGGQMYNLVLQKCQCLASKPYWTGEACVNCELPSHWVTSLQKCVLCTSTEYWNENLQVCSTCQQGYTYDGYLKKCVIVCSGGRFYNKQTQRCDCPAYTPYWNNEKCLTCGTGGHWNPSTFSCVTCNSVEHWDYTNNRCYSCPNGFIYNHEQNICIESHNCIGNKIYNTNTKKCECPSSLPYWNNSECISCEDNQHWDSTGLKCSTCGIDQIWSSVRGRCESCPSGTYYDAKNGFCMQKTTSCLGGQFFNSVLKRCECPSSKPYWNSVSCLACSSPSHWSSSSQKCITCPQGQYWGISQGQCFSCASNEIYDSITQKCVRECKGGQIYYARENRCECPSTLPYWTGNNCVTCNIGEHWVSITAKCISCSSNQYWFSKNQQCVTCQPNQLFNIENGQCQSGAVSCPGGKFYNTVLKRCECTASLPFWNGAQCIACEIGQHWNPTMLKCVTCTNGQHWDIFSQSCTVCPASLKFNYFTNKCESEIVTCSGSRVFNQQLKKCECPQTLPHWNGVSCIVCPSSQHWNKLTSSCITCNNDQIWSKIRQTCENCKQGQRYNSSLQLCVKIEEQSCKFDEETHKCKCPPNAPFLIEKEQKCVSSEQCQAKSYFPFQDKCITCYLPKYWDGEKCTSCSEGYNFDVSKKLCVQCEDNQYFNFTSYTCTSHNCAKDCHYSTAQKQCVCDAKVEVITNCSDNLFLFEGKCIQCILPKYWDGSKCTSCQQGFNFDITTKTCRNCSSVNSFYDTKLFKCVENCEEGCTYDREKSVCVCEDKVQAEVTTCLDPNLILFNGACIQCYLPNYWNGKECVSCGEGSHFDINMERCTTCGDNQVFDPILSRCVDAGIVQPNVQILPVTPVQPISVQPISTKPVAVKPISTRPTSVQPISVEPISTKPVAVRPISPYPTSVQPISVQPISTKPVYTKPTTVDLISVNPISVKPTSTIQPTTFENISVNPISAKPISTQPVSVPTSVSPIQINPISLNPSSPNYVKCPSQEPYWNGKQCMKCDYPSYWNNTTLTCNQCPNAQYYIKSLNRCSVCPQDSQYNALTLQCE